LQTQKEFYNHLVLVGILKNQHVLYVFNSK